jgi:hypothetical protein
MSEADLSLLGITKELISFSWPVLVGVGGAQVIVTRRIVSAAGPPSRSSVVAASAVSLVWCTAIAADMVNSFEPLPEDEPGFSFPGFVWFVFNETMWPVLVGLGVAQLSLIVLASSRSPRILTSVSLASTLMASWMIAWWLFVGSRWGLLTRWAPSMPWVIGLLACSCGLTVSTTTLLISRRIALGRPSRPSKSF